MLFMYIIIFAVVLFLAKPKKRLKSIGDIAGYLAISVMVSMVIILPIHFIFG